MTLRHYQRILLSLVLPPILTTTAHAAPRSTNFYTVPAVAHSAAGLVPPGWTILAAAAGDVNRDGRPDTALVLKSRKERDEPKTWDQPRLLVVALRGKDGLLHRSVVSDKVILTHGEGGVFGDPFAGIAVHHGTLIIDHYGGSRDRWAITNRYRLQNGNWIHIGTTTTSTDTFDPTYQDTVDTNLLTGFSIHTYSKGKNSYRRLFFTLRAGNVPRSPLLKGLQNPAEWPGPAIHLFPQPGGRSAVGQVRGAPPVAVRAVTSGDTLFLALNSSGYPNTLPRFIRIVSEKGRIAIPPHMRTHRVSNGWDCEAQFSLRALGVTRRTSAEGGSGLMADTENGITAAAPLTVDIVCHSVSGSAPTLYSTSPGRRYNNGIIFFSHSPGLPRLGDDPLFP